MKDKEIINALECCANGVCAECPKVNSPVNVLMCQGFLIGEALDLINRQQAAIERLENGIEELNCKLDMANDCIPEQRAEAIKEFAERLKETANSRMYRKDVVYTVEIDNLVKEMVGDTE